MGNIATPLYPAYCLEHHILTSFGHLNFKKYIFFKISGRGGKKGVGIVGIVTIGVELVLNFLS